MMEGYIGINRTARMMYIAAITGSIIHTVDDVRIFCMKNGVDFNYISDFSNGIIPVMPEVQTWGEAKPRCSCCTIM